MLALLVSARIKIRLYLLLSVYKILERVTVVYLLYRVINIILVRQ
jgi:hypothetical protein